MMEYQDAAVGIDLAEKTENDGKESQKPKKAEPEDVYLWVQIFVCLFLFGIVFFAWQQGQPFWKELSSQLDSVLNSGLCFSGEEKLTRLTDEITDFWGNLIR